MEVKARVEALREKMRKEGVDAYFITGSDPHASEYVPPRWQTRGWISGFSGSAGTVVITQKEALLWVDSRYYIQGEQQIANTPFTLQKLGMAEVVGPAEWLGENLPANSKVAVDQTCFTLADQRKLLGELKPRNLILEEREDWFDEIWPNRPPLPFSKVKALPVSIAGASAGEKIEMIREVMRDKGWSDTIISSLDDIAWILNLRGADVPYNPVFLSYLLVGMERVILFTNPERFEAGVLDRGITLKPYEEIFSYLGEHFTPSSTLYISPDRSNLRLIGALPASLKRVEGLDISTLLKSRKNKTEQEGMRLAHKADGVAMVKFLAQVASGEKCYTELTLAAELENYRRQSSDYLGPSFSTIAGFKEHGALAHYSASEESSVELVGNGLLVLDSGGQYTCGTTDITRTLLFGEASSEMMRDYTLVLKGNLALSRQQFPSQTAGYQLDSLARQFLWQAGLNYGHGTGHGVGFCLNVHEGPQNISPRPIEVALEEGMVISNEPGIYREGSHGVRVENLVMVQRGDVSEMGQFYRFEVLTLAPFERRLIDTTLLSEEEQREINDYHARVYEELQGELSEAQRAWLRQATLPL